MAKFLCAIGIHKWRPLGIGSSMVPSNIDYCPRCMRGRERYLCATFRYSPEQVKELLIEDMRRHGAEIAP
jgi:hypothetical protein